MTKCFISLGGNLDQSLSILHKTIQYLALIDRITHLTASRVYRTTPVSDIIQPLFFNAACCFISSLSLLDLWKELQKIEKEMGKKPKAKNAPRLIDIDLIFYGKTSYSSNTLKIPHPKWRQRLFVLTPLAEITQITPWGDNIKQILHTFPNPNQERVVVCAPSIPKN